MAQHQFFNCPVQLADFAVNDGLGRLTQIDYPATVGNVSGAKTIAFDHDAAGNRTVVTLSETPVLGNSPPVAAPDNDVAVPPVPTKINVLWNDREPNKQALTLVLTSWTREQTELDPAAAGLMRQDCGACAPLRRPEH